MESGQRNDQPAFSVGHVSGGQGNNRTIRSMRDNQTSSPFKLREGAKPITEMDRSDIEWFKAKQVEKRHDAKVIPFPAKSNVPPHLLMTALLEQLCHMYLPQDKDQADKLFKMLCENLSKLNVISPLSHLDEMRHLRKQHSITFRKLVGAALRSINQTQIVRALPGTNAVPNPIPTYGERIISQGELMEEFSSRYEDEFEEVNHLGTGGFGTVYKAKNKLDNRCYAIKKIPIKQKNPELLQKLLREVRVLAYLQHTNIVSYNGAWIESNNSFNSSKGTSSENTYSQGISTSESPRGKKVYESQSIEFLDDSNNFCDESLPINHPPRINLALGAKLFSQVKDTAVVTTQISNCSPIAGEFHLLDTSFNQCRITELNETSSSHYSSRIENLDHVLDKDLMSHRRFQDTNIKMETYSGINVTEIVTSSGDCFTDITSNDDDADNLVNSDILKRTTKRKHPATNTHPTQESSSSISLDRMESHLSSTGFSFSNDSDILSPASDVNTNILFSPGILPPGSSLLGSLSLSKEETTSNYIAQPARQSLQEIPLTQQSSVNSNGGISNSFQNANTGIFTSTQGIPHATLESPLQISAAQSINVDSNKNINHFSDSSAKPLSLVPLGGKFHPLLRGFSCSDVKTIDYSINRDSLSSAGELELNGVNDLKPPMLVRSTSNLEGSKYRDVGESKDHSYGSQNSTVLYIQMELCSLTLFDWLVDRNDKIDIKTRYHDALCCNNMIIFRQLLEGVHFIHSQGLIHRDLKPRNIFLSEQSGKDLHVKIGDFGLAKEEVLNEREECSILCPDCIQHGAHHRKKHHTSGVGTTGYAAPEQIQGSIYNAKSDMYSLGVILFEIFNIFTTEMERIENIKNPSQSSCLNDIRSRWPKQAKAVCHLTHEDPHQRPLPNELLMGGLFMSQEQEIKALKMVIVEKDKMIALLNEEIALLKKENDKLLGDISF